MFPGAMFWMAKGFERVLSPLPGEAKALSTLTHSRTAIINRAERRSIVLRGPAVKQRQRLVVGDLLQFSDEARGFLFALALDERLHD
jgi:hypothetical protein